MRLLGAAFGTLPWVVWPIVLPLLLALAAFVHRRGARPLAIWGSLAVATSVAAAIAQVGAHGPQRYRLGGWGAPLGIDLYADGLSAVMLLVTAVIGVCVSLYASAYYEADHGGTAEGAASFWTLWWFLWAALNALFLSGDLFNLYVTLELTTLSAVGLVAIAATRAATEAALRYLLAALIGSLLYLLGTALVYASYGTLDLHLIGQAMTPGLLSAAAIAAVIAGLAVKSALFPLHFWLPPAHANAVAPVSAVLSALVVTAAFYMVLRLWFEAFPAAVTDGAGRLIALLGAVAIVWGSIQALAADRLKVLVAYSTVAQLGYLFVVLGLAAPGATSSAWSGAVLFAVSHACAKASMFLAAGIVLNVAGDDRLAGLGSIGSRLPTTFITMGLASVTLMGLPPSGSFVAKWMLLGAAFERGEWLLAIVIAGGGVLAAAYLFRVLAHAFTATEAAARAKVPLRMEWTALGLAVAALAIGPAAAPLLRLLSPGAGVP